MKLRNGLVSVLALGLGLAQLAAMPAYAEQAAPHFRTVEAQQFSAEDLQKYGMTADAAANALNLQDNGYQIRVLSGEEAQAYRAGISDNQWLMLGILAGVIVIAVAVG
jgi:hypothetical protein